jgi:peptidoglycan hydrolase CwlO-like protein
MKYLETISEKLTQWIGTTTSIIVHTLFFIGIFALKIFDVSYDEILLILTTAVSLEAIYLSIFIQMSVNKTTQKISGVEKDIDEIQEDVGELQEDVEDISEDISEDEDEDDALLKSINDIEGRIIKLHKAVEDFKLAKQAEHR